ncbi:hypothetical protein FIBSPDRAFT_1043409 [Athelia psychrophila]|uniref:Uncharacterized protein n=1 Tax=Athelia psychrophila TaxID=1759441 RepID=A0A166LDF4_9AGAM|nr:hypothetical protein FIBSPDRAFT_1043409 [Fibularhizoctonia sp. CBS 109695]
MKNALQAPEEQLVEAAGVRLALQQVDQGRAPREVARALEQVPGLVAGQLLRDHLRDGAAAAQVERAPRDARGLGVVGARAAEGEQEALAALEVQGGQAVLRGEDDQAAAVAQALESLRAEALAWVEALGRVEALARLQEAATRLEGAEHAAPAQADRGRRRDGVEHVEAELLDDGAAQQRELQAVGRRAHRAEGQAAVAHALVQQEQGHGLGRAGHVGVGRVGRVAAQAHGARPAHAPQLALADAAPQQQAEGALGARAHAHAAPHARARADHDHQDQRVAAAPLPAPVAPGLDQLEDQLGQLREQARHLRALVAEAGDAVARAEGAAAKAREEEEPGEEGGIETGTYTSLAWLVSITNLPPNSTRIRGRAGSM